MSNDVVPFGKYKGKSVELIAATDPKYLEWLQLQPFFGTKFPKLLQAIAALSTGEVSETPEHNALQALFLDDSICAALLCLVEIENPPTKISGIKTIMEAKNGSDVALTVHFEARPKKEDWEWRERDRKLYGHASIPFEDDRWENQCTYFVELKPSLGDDYPAVLRQMRQQESRAHGYHDGDKGILIVEDFASSAISFEQLQKMFLPYRVFMIQALKDEINRAFLGKATDTGFEKP